LIASLLYALLTKRVFRPAGPNDFAFFPIHTYIVISSIPRVVPPLFRVSLLVLTIMFSSLIGHPPCQYRRFNLLPHYSGKMTSAFLFSFPRLRLHTTASSFPVDLCLTYDEDASFLIFSQYVRTYLKSPRWLARAFPLWRRLNPCCAPAFPAQLLGSTSELRPPVELFLCFSFFFPFWDE